MAKTLHTNTPVLLESEFPAGDLPERAQVVIVGGGIAGCSVAFHLARQGWKDVLLLEAGSVASGTTWHSAGQVGQLRASASQTRINRASAELYAELGASAGWLQCGGLQLASCEERWTQLQRQAAMAELFKVEADLLGPREIADRWPAIETRDLHGGIWLPGDGRVVPGPCALELARRSGVPVREHTSVEAILHKDGTITGVRTDRGDVEAEWVVLAGGMWSRQLGLGIGVDIPLYPCEHHYVITTPVEGITRDFPCGRDPDAGIYFRSLDDGGMKLGAFKLRSKAWQIGDSVPGDFHHALLDPDWEDFAGPLAAHYHRVPATSRAEIVKFVNGPESFTPDNHFLMGEPAGTRGLFVLAGFNSAGIACAGGAGKYAAEWMAGGVMPMDLLSVDIRRFAPGHNRREFLQERVTEVLGLHYAMAWPNRQMETARGLSRVPLYELHAENGAHFGESAGIERPLWFGGTAPYTFRKPGWLETVAGEITNCRRDVTVFDQSTFAKFRTGDLPGLQWLCANDIDVRPGRTVYTSMLNRRGTFESDLTVVREEEGSFYLVSSTASRWRDHDWIQRSGKCTDLEDLTPEMGVLGVMGPRSREVLGSCVDGMTFGDARRTVFAGVDVLAIRLSYVGELGWELHVPTAGIAQVYEEIKRRGASDAGYQALDTMRIEKGFRAFGRELSPDETPFEAGLGFAVEMNIDFLGRQALKNARPRKRLVSLVLSDPGVMLWGGEPIFRDGEMTGYTTSAAFSPTFDAPVALGYVREYSGRGHYEILAGGTRRPARAGLRAPFDPKRERLLS